MTFPVKYGMVTHNREKEKYIMEYETYEYDEKEFQASIEASVKEGITLGLFKDLDDDPTFLKFQEKVNEIEDAVNEDEAMLASLLFAGGA